MGVDFKFLMAACSRRLKKEYIELFKNSPPGIELDQSVVEDNFTEYELYKLHGLLLYCECVKC